MRVIDEVDQAPLQGLRSGFTPSQEEIQTTQDQVPIVKTQLAVFVVLSGRSEEKKYSQFTKGLVFGSYTVYIDWLIVSTILSPPSGRSRCSLVGCWGPDPTCASLPLPWWMPPKIWSCWRCDCEAPAGVSSMLGMHHKAVWRENRIYSVV